MASHGVLSCCRQFPHVAFLDAAAKPGLTDAGTCGFCGLCVETSSRMLTEAQSSVDAMPCCLRPVDWTSGVCVLLSSGYFDYCGPPSVMRMRVCVR
jgi:hypothetical protein